jgi:NAD-dependent oxidoreductase involved in siderophore biosynthesis
MLARSIPILAGIMRVPLTLEALRQLNSDANHSPIANDLDQARGRGHLNLTSALKPARYLRS